MANPSNNWYVCKENLQPLASGRDIKKIDTSVSELSAIRASHEEKILLYDGDDRLKNWIAFIDFIEQSYADGGKAGRIVEVISDCVSRFIDDPQYQNDERFLKIVLKHIRRSVDPVEKFTSLFNRKLFVKLALFYVEWSWHVELAGNFKEADNILQKGLDLGAEPPEKLHTAQLQLQNRLAKKIMSKEIDDISTSESTAQRKALVGLRPKLKKDKAIAPVDRVTNLKTDLQGLSISVAPAGASNASLKIFEENDKPTAIVASGSSKSSVVPHDKENQLKPDKWNTFKVKTKPVAIHQPDFVIFEEDEDDKGGVQDSALATNVFQVRKGRTDSPPLVKLETLPPNSKFYFDIDEIYIGGTEYCFEEIRYKKMMKDKKMKDFDISESYNEVESATQLAPIKNFTIYEDTTTELAASQIQDFVIYEDPVDKSGPVTVNDITNRKITATNIEPNKVKAIDFDIYEDPVQ